MSVEKFVQKVVKEGREAREKVHRFAYRSIDSFPTFSMQEHEITIAETPTIHSFLCNTEKNAYSNVPLLEMSRIVLEKFSRKEENDYIHASYFKTHFDNYILTQVALYTFKAPNHE